MTSLGPLEKKFQACKNELQRLIKEGYSLGAIANKLDASRTAVTRYAKLFGFLNSQSIQDRNPIKTNHTRESFVKQKIQLQYLLRQGMSIRSIAAQLNFSRSSVVRYAQRFGYLDEDQKLVESAVEPPVKTRWVLTAFNPERDMKRNDKFV